MCNRDLNKIIEEEYQRVKAGKPFVSNSEARRYRHKGQYFDYMVKNGPCNYSFTNDIKGIDTEKTPVFYRGKQI